MPKEMVEESPAATPTLSASDRRTLGALFAHPLAHNLTWSAIVQLFGTIGTVEAKANNEHAFQIGREHHLMRKPHSKDLTAPEVLELRHFAARAGWSPGHHPEPDGQSVVAAPAFLIVVDHHEAKIYLVDIASDDISRHVIKPYDPHHFLNHLSHKDQPRERGQWAPEDITFYQRIAAAVVSGGKIVLVGHGEGKSSAVHHLAEYLRTHHHDTYQRVVSEQVADLSHISEPQLLDIGRRALA